ncbi:MAG: septum site-determining protein MinD, partial [Cyanobacteria bacterium REEB65]|nr:septum site-determining protein MinD [Cyanobacteria bacterium REEB65]
VSAVRDADRIVGLLEAAELRNPRLIVNRLKPHLVKAETMMSVADVQEILSIALLGIVPDDEAIINSSNRGEPVALQEGSRAGQAYRNIARRIKGEEVPFMDLEEESFLSKLRRIFVGTR